jgi:RNA polymerase sigma factor (sigma-70 family)
LSSLQREYSRIIGPIETQMMRSVWRITQNADDADDAFQHATAQIWQSLARIREHPNPHALVLKICADAACDVLRQKLRHRSGEVRMDSDFIDPAAPFVADSILNQERKEQVQTALTNLSQQQATAVAMRFLMSCAYDEIASALDCAEATARVHVTRGLSRLRELLAGLNPSRTAEKSHDR